jgi:hypothetical protein
MDRRTRSMLAGCGVSLVLAVTGCRAPHSEVPPGHQYMNDGRQMQSPPTSFSSQDPRAPIGGMAAPSAMGGMNGPAGAGGLYGGSPGGMNNGYGTPSDHAYGQPGTSGLAPLTNPAPGSPASLGVGGAPAGGAADSVPSSMGSVPSASGGLGLSQPSGGEASTPANPFPPQ